MPRPEASQAVRVIVSSGAFRVSLSSRASVDDVARAPMTSSAIRGAWPAARKS
jgi:hypothetical protein